MKLSFVQGFMNVFNFQLREYVTYRVVTTNRLKAPRHLIGHGNLKIERKSYFQQVSLETARTEILFSAG